MIIAILRIQYFGKYRRTLIRPTPNIIHETKFQASEFIFDNGHGVGFTIGNIMKYAQRYGKKNGHNRDDILKIIHYAIMLLHVHDTYIEEKTS